MNKKTNSEARDEAPVFVVGCPRSGTTLLYHMLVSSGGFADYRAETHLYDMVLPRYGSLESRRTRERLLDEWLVSPQGQTADIPEERFRRRVLESCQSGGDFLSILLGEVADQQDAPRWSECTPFHLLYMEQIKAEIPDALFIHVYRDGRDVALSLRKVGWVRPLWWDRRRELLTAAWEWEWRVRTGRQLGEKLDDAYYEVSFEDLVENPAPTLDRLSGFIDYPLDHEHIMENAVGSIDRPNTAFDMDEPGNPGGSSFDPVNRWKRTCSASEVAALEASVGPTLRDFGYPLAQRTGDSSLGAAALRLRKRTYQATRSIKQWLKDETVLSRHFTRSYLDRA